MFSPAQEWSGSSLLAVSRGERGQLPFTPHFNLWIQAASRGDWRVSSFTLWSPVVLLARAVDIFCTSPPHPAHTSEQNKRLANHLGSEPKPREVNRKISYAKIPILRSGIRDGDILKGAIQIRGKHCLVYSQESPLWCVRRAGFSPDVVYKCTVQRVAQTAAHASIF